MKFNVRSGCLCLAVLLAILKIAGVLSWPWATVGVALLGWGYPYVILMAGIVGYLSLGVLTALFALGLMTAEHIGEKVAQGRRRKARAAAIKAGATRCSWDY